jgi:glycosyltransferase involved in cell wall biosynthesis
VPRPNAALFYVPSGYAIDGERVMGINVASDGVLRGLARHGGVERLYALCESRSNGEAFRRAVADIDPRLAAEWIATTEVEKIAPLGTLLLPGPVLACYAWMRRRIGAAAFSLCGVTHTTATPLILDALTDLLVAPVEPWDAVVCTSGAVRSMVSSVLEEQLVYLEERFGRLSRVRPQLPVIPLGIDTAAFAGAGNGREAARAALGLAPSDVAFLFAGRLDPVSKAHPVPLFLAAAAAARQSGAPLWLLFSGWFPSPAVETAWRDSAEMICPDVPVIIVDGREPDTRMQAWAAADVFVSPADNIQETFGLTPLEAMASGLPVIAGAWDGYRDTVRHLVDGFLVRTWTPPPGQGADLARDYGAGALGYERYIGLASQAAVIDVPGLTQAMTVLAGDPARRAEMGAAGKARATGQFDWRHVIPQYQELWVELAARRRQAAPVRPRAVFHPARPDPFWAFASYPTGFLRPETTLRIGLTAPEMIEVLLASPLIAFAAPALPEAGGLRSMVQRVERGPATVAELLGAAAPPISWRALAWLAKYDFLRFED